MNITCSATATAFAVAVIAKVTFFFFEASKGLGAGYQPIGAMLCSTDVYSAIEHGTGFFQHGHSYLGHPVATAAALAVMKELLDKNLINRSKVMGNKLESALFSKVGEHPLVGDIRVREDWFLPRTA